MSGSGLLDDLALQASITLRTLDGVVDYNDLLAILQTAASGGVNAAEFADLGNLVDRLNTSGGPTASAYLAYIARAVVKGDGANANWTGGATFTQPLGNLAAGSDETQAGRLVGKWLLGTDLPAPVLDFTNPPPIAYRTSTAPLFGASGPSIDDVNQGNLADCYLMSCLAQIAWDEPDVIRSMITDNGNGTYGVRFFIQGRQVYVTVNADLPVRADSGGLAVNHASHIWASLVEKAYAQLNENPGYLARTAGNIYNLLDFGWPDPLTEVAGRAVTTYSASGRSLANWNGLEATFASAVVNHQEIVVATYVATTVNGVQQFMAPHMYSITGYDSASGLFTLRNPYGADYGQTWLTSFQASMADLYSEQGNVFVAGANSLVGMSHDRVAVTGAAPSGGQVMVPYDDADRAQAAQSDLAATNAGVLSGLFGAVTARLEGVLAPLLGQVGELIISGGGTYAVPAGFLTTLVNATSQVTVMGGAANGQLLIAGTAGTAVNAGAGSGTIRAGGGANLVSVYPGAGSQLIDLGAGDDTVIALGGSNVIAAGGGSNRILLGAGANQVTSTGTDLIAGGAGAATITSAANAPTIFLGSTGTDWRGGTGRATVVGGAGADTLSSGGNAQLWLGSGTDLVRSAGADTIIAGSGAATVTATGNAFVFGGAGRLDFSAGGGASTVLGGTGVATLRGGGGSLVALANAPTVYVGGTGADTIAATGPGSAITVTGGSGTGVFLGGAAGGNVVAGGSGRSTIMGGGPGDVLRAGTGAGDVILAGPGAATISAAGTHGIHYIYAGAGPDLILTGEARTSVLTSTGAATIVAGSGVDLIAVVHGNHSALRIEGFSPGVDYLSLSGYAPTELAVALAGAVTSHGSEQLTLSDGTHITFAGVTGLSVANFL